MLSFEYLSQLDSKRATERRTLLKVAKILRLEMHRRELLSRSGPKGTKFWRLCKI
jgi:hypothetical protein